MKSNKQEKRVEQLLTCNNWRSQWPSWENGSTAAQPPRGRTGGGGADCVVEGDTRAPRAGRRRRRHHGRAPRGGRAGRRGWGAEASA